MEGETDDALGAAVARARADGQLTPGEASGLAGSFERLHLLWIDEPCPLSNPSAASRIAGESVTPVGFGRFAAATGIFQDPLRADAIDAQSGPTRLSKADIGKNREDKNREERISHGF